MMLLKEAKRKYMQELTLTTVVLSAGVAMVYYWFLPGRYFAWFPLIPVFFFLFSLFYINMFAFNYRLGQDKIAMTYLMCKVLKFIVSALVLLFYGFVIGEQVMDFMGTFILFYLVFLAFETRFFLRFEAKLKLSKQIENEKNTVHSNNAAAVVGNSDNDVKSGDRG